MSEHLLCCPFCGGEAVMEEIENSIYGHVRFSVGCNNDQERDCMGYQSMTSFARRSDAASAWNTRNYIYPGARVTRAPGPGRSPQDNPEVRKP